MDFVVNSCSLSAAAAPSMPTFSPGDAGYQATGNSGGMLETWCDGFNFLH